MSNSPIRQTRPRTEVPSPPTSPRGRRAPATPGGEPGTRFEPKTNPLDRLPHESGEIIVDFVGRFENLTADFVTICERVGANDAALLHKKKNAGPGRAHDTEYDTPELRDMIGEKFAPDIERFGYAFGD